MGTQDFEKRKKKFFFPNILNHQKHYCRCNMCGDSFSAISALAYHVRMHHGKMIKPSPWKKQTLSIANDLNKSLEKSTDENVERHTNKDSGQNFFPTKNNEKLDLNSEPLQSKIQHTRGPVWPIMQSSMMTIQSVREFPENPNTCSLLKKNPNICSLLNKKVDNKCENYTENENIDVDLEVLRINKSILPENLKLHSYFKPGKM